MGDAVCLDRFGGPSAWDRHCEAREAAYEALARAGSCGRCAKCRVPSPVFFPGRQDVGFCVETHEFVASDANPWDEGCESYEE